MRSLRFYTGAVAALLAAAMAACSSGAGGVGGTGMVPSAGGRAAQPARKHRTAPLHFGIKIPKKHRRGGRGPRFVSPATQGMTIAISGPTNYSATVALTVASGNCTSSLSSITCALTIPGLAIGDYTASISTYDAVSCSYGSCSIPGYANLLSGAQSVPFTIVAGVNNSIAVTLGGVAAGLVVTPMTDFRMTGSGGVLTVYGNDAVKFTVTPVDADDNFIVGAGAPQPTASLAPGAQANLTAPGTRAPNEWSLASTYEPSDPAVASTTSITVSATPVPGSGGSTVTKTIPLALYQPWIYVSDDVANTVRAYDEQGNLKSTVSANFTRNVSGPSGMAYDPHNGSIYVAEYSGWLLVFDRAGGLENAISSVYPNQVAFDSHNDWIYAISYTGAAAAYDESGNVQSTPGGFPNVTAAVQTAFDPETDLLYTVCNSGDRGIQVNDETGASVTTTGGFPNFPSNGQGAAYVGIDGAMLFSDGASSVYGYDGGGNAVLTLQNLPDTRDIFNIAWDPYAGTLLVTNRSSNSVTAYDLQGNEHAFTSAISGFSDVQGVIVVK